MSDAPKPYREFEPDDLEPELDEQEMAYFKQRLLAERTVVSARLSKLMSTALTDTDALPDEVDQASRLSEQQLMFKSADKARKLLSEINHALVKFDQDDEYGICEGTGDPIRRKRLDSRPWTRYSVEHKAKLERHRRR